MLHFPSSVLVLPLKMTTFRDSYLENHKELAAHPTLSASQTLKVMIETVTIGSVSKCLAIEHKCLAMCSQKSFRHTQLLHF